MNLEILKMEADSFLKGEPALKELDYQKFMQVNCSLLENYNSIIRQKEYSAVKDKTITEATEKAKNSIQEYIQNINTSIDKYKAEQTNYENQKYIIDEHNRNVRWEIHTRKDKLHRLGFFDGAEKKRLQAEIDSFKEEPYQMDYDTKINHLKGKIKALEDNLKPFYELIKGYNYYSGEADRYYMTQEYLELKEKRNRPKTQKATTTAPQKPKKAPKLKDLKEVHKPKEKPNLKPLKYL